MVNQELLAEVRIFIPEGERSNFVNKAISDALVDYKRQKAFDDMAKLRKETKLSMTTKEFIRLKNEGRP